MSQLLSIVDDKLVVEKMNLRYLEGNVMHVGKMDIKGGLAVAQDVSFNENLKVKGYVEADTIRVKNLITEDATQTDAFTFHAASEDKLENKGLVWGIGEDQFFQLVLRTEPRRIYSSESIDLHRSAKYQIDGMDVLLKDSLGSVVKKSKLTELGVLDFLEVDGNTNLSNTLLVNSYLNRVGINTEKPNAALSVLDNGVEVVIGGQDNRAVIGTWSNQALDIVTDNTSRININGNNITFGNSTSKSAVVKINGTLEVDSLVTDIRLQRTSPLEFLGETDAAVYGKGMIWNVPKQTSRTLILQPNPDRIHSSENLT